MSVVALIVAAGRGVRAGLGGPKQYRDLAGRPVLARTLAVFLAQPEIDHVLVVIHPDDEATYRAAIAGIEHPRLLSPALGGATRRESVLNGLEALAGRLSSAPRLCLVHDAARPLVSPDLIARAIEAGLAHGAAVPGLAVTDTIKRVDDAGYIIETPPRASLRAVQTPQAFAFENLLAAHRDAQASGIGEITDDAQIMEEAGRPVFVFAGDPHNIKLTLAGDFEIAARRLGEEPMAYISRTGTGFDVHAFGEGDHVWLGGVRIAHEQGVLAHSDGDVVLHALTDALLGALADGDIGVHFPPSDPAWRGASSDQFLAFAAARVRARGGIIDLLDATLLCEKPRLGPHREAIRARIAEIAGIDLDSVSIKATTTERLGFTGRSEGLASLAAATIRLPEKAAS